MVSSGMHTSYAKLSSGIPWNVPRVTCISRILYPMPKSSENLQKFSEELGNLRGISENFRNASNRSKMVLKFSE